MADGGIMRLGQAGKLSALALVAVTLIAGLLVLPANQPTRRTTHTRNDAQLVANIRALNSALGTNNEVPTAPSPYSPLVPTDAPVVQAKAAYLINPSTGMVFYSSNALAEVPMASTTKIMTAIVAMTFGTPSQRITIGDDAVKEQNGENSVAGLQKGDVLSLQDLLYALLLPSGDDAAVAIADGVAGSQQNFVGMMNMEAALLGLDHTHYANVHGLDAKNHYTTVGDLARIARVAMNFPLFAQIVKTPVHVAQSAIKGQYTWHTTNELLTTHLYQGTIGVKTGHTGGAGYCLVFAASRAGTTLIGVLLGEQDLTGEQRFADATALLNWGFARQQTIAQWMNAIAGKSSGS